MNTITNALAATALATLALAGHAATTTLSGNLGDAGNAALVGSDLGAPGFGDDNTIADNVALYSFYVVQDGAVSVTSTGFVAGGVDPYFSLFAGSGVSATFVDSNYAQATSTAGDFTWSGMLAKGSYEIALGSFENLSIAENYGFGTLGDGFTFLGDPNSLGNGGYSLTLTTPIPEPSNPWLMAVGVAVLAARGWRARRAA